MNIKDSILDLSQYIIIFEYNQIFRGKIMKYISFFLIFLIFALLYTGCDSATDSKPVSNAPPVLLKPYDNDTNVSINTTFEWSGTADVIWLDINPSFSNPQSFSVTGNSYTVTDPLSIFGNYYWKAGRTIGGTVYWSENYYHFVTGGS